MLEELKRDGRSAAPPTVYRALDFLVQEQLVHRIPSLNAYLGCNAPGAPHCGQFLICRDCRITSYNVCYTKLLRMVHLGGGAGSGGAHPFLGHV